MINVTEENYFFKYHKRRKEVRDYNGIGPLHTINI